VGAGAVTSNGQQRILAVFFSTLPGLPLFYPFVLPTMVKYRG